MKLYQKGLGLIVGLVASTQSYAADFDAATDVLPKIEAAFQALMLIGTAVGLGYLAFQVLKFIFGNIHIGKRG